MSLARFDDECPGCRPAMLNVKTGQPYADDSAVMVIVNGIWAKTSAEERRAWHCVTCQNSRSLVDVQIAKAFVDRVEAALAAVAKEKS